MSTTDTVFKAVAHPARRKILSLLAQEPRSVKELASRFAISQPAVSQHLKELREAQLVAAERIGVEQRYRITPRPLRHIVEWSEPYRYLLDPQGHLWQLAATPSQEAKPSVRTSRKSSPKSRRPSNGR